MRPTIPKAKHAAVALMLKNDRKNFYTQQQIALQLGISQSAVAKISARLYQEEIVETRVNQQKLVDMLGDEAVEAGKRLVESSPLFDKLKRLGMALDIPAPRVTAFSSLVEASAPAQGERRFVEFGRNGAWHALRLLEHAQKVGITWGGTLAALVAGIENLGSPLRKNNPLQVIPLCGDPANPLGNRYSSTALAESLQRALNGELRGPLSLSLLPAFIPTDLTRIELAAMRKVIRRVPGYREIFGNETGAGALAAQVDTILTGISAPDRPLGYGMGTLAQAAGLHTAQLRELVLGDIGGVLLERPDLTKRQQEKFQAFVKSWTGLSREHVAICAANARKPNALGSGCVVVAMGSHKAHCLYAAMREKLVNHAIVDLELAASLENLLP